MAKKKAKPKHFSNRRLAILIARDLFTDVAGTTADRLVMEISGKVGSNSSGWCEAAVVDRIELHLKNMR